MARYRFAARRNASADAARGHEPIVHHTIQRNTSRRSGRHTFPLTRYLRVLCLSLVLSIAACGAPNQASTTTSAASTPAAAATTPATPPAPTAVAISASAVPAATTPPAPATSRPAPPTPAADPTEDAPTAITQEDPACASRPADQDPVRFAVIGDYGNDGDEALSVANLIKSWATDFIVTTGDNNYADGAAETIDKNIGQYYHPFICPYLGTYGPGATINRFFPSLGNHDWHTPDAKPYLDYFTLPGNERYYNVRWGPVQLFIIDSDSNEPDGTRQNSRQARWLEDQLAQSQACWDLVVMHHPPFSSGKNHGSTSRMQWPYQEWGADAVLAGHDHTYERIVQDGFPYFVNGLGGQSTYDFAEPVAGSEVRFNDEYGAMLVEASADTITFQFVTDAGEVIDTYSLNKPCA